MELTKFINLIADQFEETSKDIFNAETKFQELEEYDSLIALSIIAVVDEEMEKRITGADIRECITIKDLFDLSMSK